MEFLPESCEKGTLRAPYALCGDAEKDRAKSLCIPLNSIDEYNELFKLLDEQIEAVNETVRKIKHFDVKFKITI